MFHVSIYRDILVSAMAYNPDEPDPRVHIDIHDGESTLASGPERFGYLDISPEQAWQLAHELIAAAGCCKGKAQSDTSANV